MNLELAEEYGAGFEGTKELLYKYLKDTPGQKIVKYMDKTNKELEESITADSVEKITGATIVKYIEAQNFKALDQISKFLTKDEYELWSKNGFEGRTFELMMKHRRWRAKHMKEDSTDSLIQKFKETGVKEAVVKEKSGETYEFVVGRPVPAHRHPNGGGWVADSAHVDKTAYVGEDAVVYDRAQVRNKTRVEDNAAVFGDAQVFDHAQILGESRVYDKARVYDFAWVYGNALVYGKAEITDDAKISGEAQVYGNAKVYQDAQVFGSAHVYEDAQVYGDARVFGDAQIKGKAKVGFKTVVKGREVVSEEMKELYAVVDENNIVLATASNEQAAKRSISSSELPPLSVKDKTKLRIVKTRKQAEVGESLKEETAPPTLEEARRMKIVSLATGSTDSDSLLSYVRSHAQYSSVVELKENFNKYLQSL